jgi:hypothetical protein
MMNMRKNKVRMAFLVKLIERSRKIWVWVSTYLNLWRLKFSHLHIVVEFTYFKVCLEDEIIYQGQLLKLCRAAHMWMHAAWAFAGPVMPDSNVAVDSGAASGSDEWEAVLCTSVTRSRVAPWKGERYGIRLVLNLSSVSCWAKYAIFELS